jgi:hypothetical protein
MEALTFLTNICLAQVKTCRPYFDLQDRWANHENTTFMETVRPIQGGLDRWYLGKYERQIK